MCKKNDSLCKGTLEDFFKEFLQFTFKDINKFFDLDRPFEFLNKELNEISRGYQIKHPKFVDLLAKVYYKESNKFALFHVEIQGYHQKAFPRRMHNYFMRLRDKYDADICSFVIFTDHNNDFRPDNYEYKFMTTLNLFRFGTYKVNEQKDEALRKNNNPFAMIIRIILLSLKSRKFSFEYVFNQKIILAKEILSMKLPDNQRDTLYTFLRHYVNLGSSKMNSKFDNIIEPVKNNVMGLLEMVKIMDREEAVRKNSLLIAKRMVKLGLSATTIQKSTGLEEKIIKNMQQRLSVSHSAR